MTQALGESIKMLSGLDFQDIERGAAVDGHVRRADGYDMAVGSLSLGDHACDIASSTNHTLILAAKASGKLYTEVDAQKSEVAIRSGTFVFATPGTDQFYDFVGDVTNIAITLDDALIKTAAEIDPELGNPGTLEPRAEWVRPPLQRVVEELHAVLFSDSRTSRVLIESLRRRLAFELLSALRAPSVAGNATALSKDEIARIIDFIEAEMEDNFDLSDLAGVLDRDPFAFSRCFKLSTGASPHQYVIQRRLMRVKDLLLNSEDTLADIAYATGFSNQAHMTSTFSKHVGISPGKWREEFRA